MIKLSLPPGLYRVGTEYQSEGRFYNSNLWRWSDGVAGPIGGWEALATGITGKARGLHGWVDLSGVSRVAVATEQEQYVVSTTGTKTTITPSGWTDPSAESAFSIDNAGQQLFYVNDEDGVIRTWVPGDVAATSLTNAPTGSGLIVTDERILMVFGAGGDPRLVEWCDVEGFTVWTEATTNFARTFPVQTNGVLLGAKKITGGLLLWSSEDLHLVRFVDRPNVYGFQRVGDECGMIARQASAVVSDQAYWMGRNSFHVWNGGVSELPCSVKEDVFGTAAAPARGINRSKAHLVRCGHVAEFNEIWWLYPKGSATENTTAVVYNYAENHWSLHDLARLAIQPRLEGFPYPLMTDGSGNLWQHEKGTTRSGAGTIFARSGPVEFGEGEDILYAHRMFPDEGNAGDVQVYFHARQMPNASETTHGPYTCANPTDVRFAARQVAVEYRYVSGEGKVGDFRFEVTGGGKR